MLVEHAPPLLLFVAREAYTWLIVYPLAEFYKRGLWRGRHPHDICAQLTQHDANFWQRHLDACAELIHRDFDAWLAYAHLVLYGALLWALTCRLLCCCRWWG